MTKFLFIFSLALGLSACAPSHLQQRDLVLQGCGALAVVKTGNPNIWLLHDMQLACDNFAEAVQISREEANDLLWDAKVNLHFLLPDDLARLCNGHEACTYRLGLREYEVILPARDPRTSTPHEITHVLLWQYGVPARAHHKFMHDRDLCWNGCGEYMRSYR